MSASPSAGTVNPVFLWLNQVNRAIFPFVVFILLGIIPLWMFILSIQNDTWAYFVLSYPVLLGVAVLLATQSHWYGDWKKKYDSVHVYSSDDVKSFSPLTYSQHLKRTTILFALFSPLNLGVIIILMVVGNVSFHFVTNADPLFFLRLLPLLIFCFCLIIVLYGPLICYRIAYADAIQDTASTSFQSGYLYALVTLGLLTALGLLYDFIEIASQNLDLNDGSAVWLFILILFAVASPVFAVRSQISARKEKARALKWRDEALQEQGRDSEEYWMFDQTVQLLSAPQPLIPPRSMSIMSSVIGIMMGVSFIGFALMQSNNLLALPFAAMLVVGGWLFIKYMTWSNDYLKAKRQAEDTLYEARIAHHIASTNWPLACEAADNYFAGASFSLKEGAVNLWANNIDKAEELFHYELETYDPGGFEDQEHSIRIIWGLYHLARAQMLDGRYAEAEKTLTEALEFYKEETLPFIGLAELEMRRGGSAQVALDYLEQAGDLTHENPLILEPDRRLLKAWVLAALGRRDEAADLLDAVYAEIDKRDAFRMGVYHLYNGYVAHASGDASTAQTEFDRAISYDRQGLITRLAQLASGQIEESMQKP